MRIFKHRQKQEGAATLLIVLLLLLAITIPSIAILKSTTVRQQMVSGSADRARTFQAAETALLEGEIMAATKPTAPSSGCSGGVCAIPSGEAPWKASGFWASGGAKDASQAITGVQSKYVVEFLGISTATAADCTTGGDISPDAKCDQETSRYRITARSLSETGAEVILQSNFRAP